MLSINTMVPNFNAVSNKGPISLADYKGKYLIIYFYPKDNTPGCTLEAQDFRDLHEAFIANNAEVIGVSRDTIASHTKFECKYDLPFPLISDTNSKICDLFGVINTKSIFGNTALGIIRSTFLIDPDGALLHEWKKVKVTDHAREVLACLIKHAKVITDN